MIFTLSAFIKALPTYGWVVLCSVSIYLFLIFGFRFIGRRQLGQLTVIDLVVIVVMGSAVETAMIHGDVGLGSGIVCAATLMATNRLISVLARRYRHFRHFVSGGPVLLVDHGKIVDEHLRLVGFTDEDVLAAIRGRGYAGLDDVKFAVMEEDGEVTVIPASTLAHKTPASIRTVSRPGPGDPPTSVHQSDAPESPLRPSATPP